MENGAGATKASQDSLSDLCQHDTKVARRSCSNLLINSASSAGLTYWR
jgi:hypothetical protein